MELDGKIVLLVGGAGGIGQVEARVFAGAGATVAIADRPGCDAETLAREIRAAGGRADAVEMDVTDPVSVDTAFAELAAGLGGLDILVANNGLAGPAKDLTEITPEEWSATVAVNLTGMFLLCRAAVPIMRQRGWGRIVLTGSTTGKRPVAGRTPYAATKLAMVGLARSLAHEVGRDGITVNVISPFDVESPRIEGMFQRMASEQGVSVEEVRRNEEGLTAVGRLVQPADVAQAALWLFSDAAGAITGQDINVSCGAVTY